LQVGILRRIAPPIPLPVETIYEGQSKLAALLGTAFLDELKDLTVIDFGCGEGHECIEMAGAGASLVVGVDNREAMIEKARQNAVEASVASRCEFTIAPSQRADLVVSIDSFEHFQEPEIVLDVMYDLLKPGGHLVASWGPPWYHPFGPHLLELPPWTHLFFSERAMMKWRSYMRSDGATRFCEAEGGLNQMTVSRFERMVQASRFETEFLRAVPIRKLNFLHNRWTREFTTAVVQCRLRRPD
jgi:SAM-dependent methyltransferase